MSRSSNKITCSEPAPIHLKFRSTAAFYLRNFRLLYILLFFTFIFPLGWVFAGTTKDHRNQSPAPMVPDWQG